MSTVKPVTRGRPRDEAIRVRIITTAVSILINEGLSAATMNEIAARAEVGKQTVYRWWRNRAQLLMEALQYNTGNSDSSGKQLQHEVPLETFLEKTFAALNKTYGVILKSLIAESMADKEFFKVFQKEFILKRQDALMYVLRNEIHEDDFDDKFAEAAIDMIFGAMWYRLLFEHRPLDGKFAYNISTIVIGKRRRRVEYTGR